ncbi:Do family serine endopeptidase [Aquabacter spiritensis]|uniref:Probable periplasmic serine endoprotease DegP-like n=1 Tax=Aquabacter spiritensis TaxID=933073 RepID=A0A4R3M303_9HYPH|nr:Do family serine endopeptidase [Aquabacter spiritensis]TCT07594.1 serine protease Do [Aquabacter spiritensis]
MTGITSPSSRVRRRRAALLAGAVGLAMTGVVAGQFLPPYTSPASAQISTNQSAGQNSFADVVEKVSPAVVSVKVKKDVDPRQMAMGEDGPFGGDVPPQIERFLKRFGFEGGPNGQPRGPRGGEQPGRRVAGQGSGFIISADGYVVTNNHVIDGASEVDVTTTDGKDYTAKVIGTDPRTDVALLKIEGKNDLPWVKLSDTPPRIGDWVIAVGNPFGLGGTVTAGIVSARGRDIGAGPYDDFLQIDAAVNRGNSGGPTFGLNGEVIGMNTAIVSPSGGNVGIAFAIPSETVKTVVNQLRESGKVARGYIGVQIQPVTDDLASGLGLNEAQGALIAQVQPDTPAAKAGLKSGDVVAKVNGDTVKDARDLSRRIGMMKPGSTVALSVIRDGKTLAMDVKLEQLPNEQQASLSEKSGGKQAGTDVPRLGLQLAPAKSVQGAGTEGVVVTEVDPNGAAAQRGIRSGDVILDVGGKAVSSANDVRDGLAAAKAENRKAVLMRVKGEQGVRFVAVTLSDKAG